MASGVSFHHQFLSGSGSRNRDSFASLERCMTCSAAGTVLLETPPHGQEREGEEADECCHALTQDTLSPCSLDCPITAPAKKQEFFQESHLVSQAFRVSGTLFFPFIPEEFFHLKSISGKEPVYLLCLAFQEKGTALQLSDGPMQLLSACLVPKAGSVGPSRHVQGQAFCTATSAHPCPG